MNQFLKIALWNANGLVEHYQETKLFITNQNIDILLVSETHFTDRTFFTIPNYKLFSTEHPNNRPRGGAAVLIRSSIKHYEM
jgi:exonuclease III